MWILIHNQFHMRSLGSFAARNFWVPGLDAGFRAGIAQETANVFAEKDAPVHLLETYAAYRPGNNFPFWRLRSRAVCRQVLPPEYWCDLFSLLKPLRPWSVVVDLV